MHLNERGYRDCILRVDLSTGSIRKEPLPAEAMPALLGGKGLGAYLLMSEVAPAVDPLSPANRLIIDTGPLTGTRAPTAGRMGTTTKSPATGTYSDAYCGGVFGQMMKLAGYDAVVIQGAAAEPMVLVLDGDRAELRPAADLWGATVPQANDRLHETFGHDWQSLVIGPPAENKSLIASIFNGTRALARGGAGAVMGSKRLKAILARGSASVVVHNAGQFRRGLQRMNRAIQASSALRRLSKEGTAGILELVNYAGALPTRNFQQGQFEQADAISADAWRSRRWKRASSCASCSIACGKVAHTVDGGRVDNPEYETIFAAGSNLGIGDQEAILRMAQVCDEYGIDTISAGAIIAFTMEMFEKGIISGSALDGIEPRFGDVASAQALLGKLARMEGCGVWLSEGVARIAQRYPQAAPFAMHSKGLEMPAYHPNAAKGVALGYAVSERGACHLRGAPISELLGAGNPRTTEGKASLLRDRQIESALWNSAILCSFPSMGVGLDDLREVINAATGFDYAGAAEFKQVGERIVTLCRLFNVREGFTRPQDTLPARSLSQPLSSGPAHGQVVELNPMLDEYYALMGWDAQGIPTHECVHRLGLEAFVTPPRL